MYPKECERIIRSVLNSTSADFSITGLVQDFLELVGVDIPFKQFGFSTMVEYLNSIHWILLVDTNEDSIEIMPSRKSEHIYQMIQAELGLANCDNMKNEFISRSL